jgi:hypothetical protein
MHLGLAYISHAHDHSCEGAYLELTVQNVFVFHAHAFNIALLLAVDPPTAQEAETKPGA